MTWGILQTILAVIGALNLLGLLCMLPPLWSAWRKRPDKPAYCNRIVAELADLKLALDTPEEDGGGDMFQVVQCPECGAVSDYGTSDRPPVVCLSWLMPTPFPAPGEKVSREVRDCASCHTRRALVDANGTIDELEHQVKEATDALVAQREAIDSLRVIEQILRDDECQCVDPPCDREDGDGRGNDQGDPAAHAQHCPRYLGAWVSNVVNGTRPFDPDRRGNDIAVNPQSAIHNPKSAGGVL